MVDIEIERERLKNYLCTQSLLSWTIVGLLFGFLFTMASITEVTKAGIAASDVQPMILRHAGAGFACTLLCILLGHFFISRRFAVRHANSLKIAVEGSFLHIREHTALLIDRKLHFRAIVDYATTQSALMRRFGIYALRMTTTAGGTASTILIPGVKDCLSIRDMLSDIDRLRENQ